MNIEWFALEIKRSCGDNCLIWKDLNFTLDCSPNPYNHKLTYMPVFRNKGGTKDNPIFVLNYWNCGELYCSGTMAARDNRE